MKDTKQQFEHVIAICRDLFCEKTVRFTVQHGVSCALHLLPIRYLSRQTVFVALKPKGVAMGG